MDKDYLLRRTVLPVVVACSALALSPAMTARATAAPTEVAQQNSVIKGTVVDEQGEPIIGATIIVVGGNANEGTISDIDGNFSIKVPGGG